MDTTHMSKSCTTCGAEDPTGTCCACDCGHAPSSHTPSTTGTAHTPDGRIICYACADDEQRTALLSDNQAFAYLSRDRKTVNTWTGGTLGKVTRYTIDSGRWSTFGIVHRCYVRVTDVHGQTWHGTGPVENGDYVRLRKTVKHRA